MMINSMHRFFLPPDCIHKDEIYFPAETAHQIKQVLRLHEGETVMALDNQGMEYEVKLVSCQPHAASGKILDRRLARGEPAVRLALFLCLSQREKFEWMLQKCTEVGVSSFVPLISSRSLVQEPSDAFKKYPRWQKIIREAAEQSRRGCLPVLAPPLTFEQALQESRHADRPALLFWEAERALSLQHALVGILPGQKHLSMLIGPEGGFSAEEAAQAVRAGLISVSLGPRILRVETAALVAAALVLYLAGEMNP